ncbi:MAG: hypothetical protein IT291_06730 [Deltaproteobacteria bacterium]|nr:hypothetical protein [Deltaproteobacteria bacterium]
MIFIEYNAIVIDPDINSRTKLKSAAYAVHNFRKVQSVAILESALSVLHESTNEAWDIIFISHNFSHDDVTAFIEQAKKTKAGEDCAYIVVLKGNEQGGSTIAREVMKGAHGVLFEPYSVDRLLEISQLAAKVKLENAFLRKKAAMELLIKEVQAELDKIASYKSIGCNVQRFMKRFANTCKPIANFDEDSLSLYYVTIADMFMAAVVPEDMKYKGASSRIKDRVKEKIRQQFNLEMREIDMRESR